MKPDYAFLLTEFDTVFGPFGLYPQVANQNEKPALGANNETNN